jgi:hypothetical protein
MIIAVQSTSATIIDSITWAINDIVANNRQHLSVINLSLGLELSYTSLYSVC